MKRSVKVKIVDPLRCGDTSPLTSGSAHGGGRRAGRRVPH